MPSTLPPKDYFHKLGYRDIVIFIQDGTPRLGGNRWSEDKTRYVIYALDKDGRAVKSEIFHTYSPAKGDSYIGGSDEEVDPAAYQRLVEQRGTLENPRKRNPDEPPWCNKCGSKMRTYENRRGNVHVCRCGNRLR